MSIRFVSPSFHDERAVRFRYRLAGDARWSDPMMDNAVALAGLGPGSYAFEVEALSGDGTSSVAPAAIRFTVLPAFYETWWFLLAMVLAAGGVLAALPTLRARRLERERLRLEGLVHTHTRELEARARSLEHEIRERQRLEVRLLEAHRMETAGRIAGGVAHEFNNLLTSVLGHAQLLAEELPVESPLAEDLSEIERAATRGAGLVSHLLGFSRRQLVESRALQADVVVLDLKGLLRALVRPHTRLEVSAEEGLPPV